MQEISPVKFAAGILTLMMIGIGTGFFKQDPLLVNDFLYNIGVWDWVQ